MADITPNSTIKLLKNCPLDNTYDHTIYFASKSAQSAYFSSLAKYTLNNQTYQRVNRNRMRVQYKADDLYDCNYLMFQNTSFGSKWFYAFIKSVEYVNNITSEIEYELDVMQSWFFDYNLGQCMIDREHSSTDVIGDNTVPENVELGDYVTDDFDGYEMNGLSIVVAATFDKDYQDVGGARYGGIFSACMFHVFPNDLDGAAECRDFIRDAGTKAGGIVAVFLMPTAFVTEEGKGVVVKEFAKTKKVTIKRSDGTNAKNNKLLTYPYNFLYVTNLQGNSAEFHYEFFEDVGCTFTIWGDMSPTCNVVLAPRKYKGTEQVNYDERIVLSGFPQLCYAADSFKEWLANNATAIATNSLTSAISSSKSMALANAGLASAQAAGTSAAIGAAGVTAAFAPVIAGVATAQVLAPVVQHYFMPDQARGNLGGTTLAAAGMLKFAFMHKHIKPEFVDIIDDYFTMYGYACHRVKVPNRNVRKQWTYTRTIGCVVHGDVPCNDMNKICSIYNNGITFWRNGANIGNYSLDNSIG